MKCSSFYSQITAESELSELSLQACNVIQDIGQAPDWPEHVLTKSRKVQIHPETEKASRAKSACSLVKS